MSDEQIVATIHSLYHVANWNASCGKLPQELNTDAYWDALSKQAERIQEELTETIDKGINARNFKELVDGICDLDVTVSGLGYLSGLNVLGAMEAVLENNNLKMTLDKAKAEEELQFYIDKFGEDSHVIVEVEGQTDHPLVPDQMIDVTIYSIHRVSDDKVCKFSDHPEVDLSEFLPE